MKVKRGKRKCGTLLEKPETHPAREVLDDQGEIFSCGGVYLGLNRPSVPLTDRFEILHLPNYLQGSVVLNNRKILRRAGITGDSDGPPAQEPTSTQETLKRFFKESLN